MSEVALFDNMPDEYKSLLAQLEPDTNATGGRSKSSSGGPNRLSIRGGVFRQVINGAEVGELEQRVINVVIVKTAPIARQYYAGEYVQGQNNPPVCWSGDSSTGKPSADVVSSDRQSETCFDCPQNVKGSGGSGGRACRFSQRVAVMLANAEGKIVSKDLYQLQLPATSVFGDNKQKMGLQTYARFLDSKKAPLASLLTEIRFDTDSSTPKLCFKPVRMLDQDELAMALENQKSEETAKLIALTVKPKEDSEPVAIAAPQEVKIEEPVAPVVVEDTPEEEIEEPKVKVSKKKTAEKPADVDLVGLLDEFDD